MKNKIITIMFIITLLLLSVAVLNVKSEPTIYADISTASELKTITINDDLNYKLLTDYKYDVYVNGNFIGKYAKDEQIFIPDNSDVLIYVPAPITTDYGTVWDLGKTYFAIAIMFLFTIGLAIVLIWYFYKKTTRRY